jgi:hypothetical protein
MGRRSAKETGSSFKGTTFNRMDTVSESGAITKAPTQSKRRHFAEQRTGRNTFARTNQAVLDVEANRFKIVMMRAYLVNGKLHAIAV